jgi:hypothetical protein
MLQVAGRGPLPSAIDNLQFWAALGENGKLWVSDARWGQGGAFLLEYPHFNGEEARFGLTDARQTIVWDGNFAQFYQAGEQMLVMAWPAPPAETLDAPWLKTPRHTAHSMVDLLTSVSFEPVNLAPSPARMRWPDVVQFNVVDPVLKRASALMQEKSELLCHSEAWLAGLRFEKLRREEIGPGAALDAAELLSVLSTSVNQCPIELRLMEIFDFIETHGINWSQLHRIPEGDWLRGVIEDLTQSECRAAQCLSGSNRLPDTTAKNERLQFGTLQAWVSRPNAQAVGSLGFTRRTLTIHASGPLFGPLPITLRRDFVKGDSWFPRGLRVVLGEAGVVRDRQVREWER